MYGEGSNRSTGGWFENDDQGRSFLCMHRPVVQDLVRRLDGVESVLDLGSGIGMYGEVMRTKFALPKAIKLIAVDGYAPYLRNPRIRAYYTRSIVADIFDVVEGKVQVPTECVLCMDVVEHFERERALKLLDWLRARKLAYISTPLFWYEQDGTEWGNLLEAHHCHFESKELEALGWIPVLKIEVYHDKEIGAYRNVL